MPLLRRRFRTNTEYQFVPFRHLTETERELFADLAEHADNIGILRPQPGSSLGVKNATRSTAALARLMRHPGLLPEGVRASEEPRIAHEIAALVLDGVLEVEEGGDFLTGPNACDLVLDTSIPERNRDDPLALISHQALRYAAALEIEDANTLSARLYFYNRRPTTPLWAHRLSSESAVERYLGTGENGALARLLAVHWNRLPAGDIPGWANWRSRLRHQRRSPQSPTYKLYLSPALEAVPDALQSTLPVLAEYNAPDFKVGSDHSGLVRPDKIVVYVDSFDELQTLAEALGVALSALDGHGVPFTAGLQGTLLSWGMDPPRALKPLKWHETESWRLWVTNRLAVYLLAARASSCSLPSWQYALARLRFEGVDISTWTPSPLIWPARNRRANGDH